jgi:hypothetical protein
MRLGLLTFWGFLTGLFDFAGSGIDPLGRPEPTADAGPNADPLG